jgi:hypothetical protein
VLTSSVIKHLRNRYKDSPDTALAYFYFSFSDIQKQNPVVMVSSLIKQLCCCRPDTPRPIKDLARYKDRGEKPDLLTLESALAATARGFRTVFIVLDGLDESPLAGGERKRLLETLLRLISAMPDSVHWLLASRPEIEIETALSHLLQGPGRASINLSHQEEVSRDIELLVDERLADNDFSSWPKDLKDEVREELIRKADGMYEQIASLQVLVYPVANSRM